jgi:Kdo2-lipid IVA lauroyltransferase/acyltransferase
MSRFSLWFLQMLAYLPLPLLRLVGAGLGHLLRYCVPSRRRVVLTNLRLCFPDMSESQRENYMKEVFIFFAQAWLDRSWLWHRNADCIRSRVQIKGDQYLKDRVPTVLFAPHFFGLDAGWTALTLAFDQPFTTIYTPQSNLAVDEWIAKGRQRFGNVRLFRREDGVKAIVSALRQNEWLYLLPDMNFGPSESIFVPFYGIEAATVPSLSRFASLGRARVVPVVTRLTNTGYEVELLPPWTDFPSKEAKADTQLMNGRLQEWINAMPSQYYWVHKRFKTRPQGQPDVY